MRHVWPQVHRWQPLAKASSQNKTACKRHVLMSRSTHDPNFRSSNLSHGEIAETNLSFDHFIHHSSIPPFHRPGAHGFQLARGLMGCGAGATRPGNGAAGDKWGKRFSSRSEELRELVVCWFLFASFPRKRDEKGIWILFHVGLRGCRFQ